MEIVGIDPDNVVAGGTPMAAITWRMCADAKDLWLGMRRPTADEWVCLKRLLTEMRERNWAQGLFLYSREYVFDEYGNRDLGGPDDSIKGESDDSEISWSWEDGDHGEEVESDRSEQESDHKSEGSDEEDDTESFYDAHEVIQES